MEKGPRRPRIGFDARALVFPAGGVRRYVREIFSLLPALEPSIDFIAVDPPPGIELPPGTRSGPHALGLPTNLARAAVALPVAVRRAGLDLFHAPAYTAPLSGHTRVVLTIHDVSYARCPEFYAHRAGPVRQWFYRRSATRAARVITDSEFSRREIAAAYALPESEVAVIPLGVGAPFAPASVDPAAILPSGIAPPYVLHVGDLHPRRDLITALRAVLAVRARGPLSAGTGRAHSTRLQLVCAGVDCGSAAPLRKVAAAAGEPDALVLTGAVPEGDLVTLYQHAAAFVYPSRYEGFGLPVLEAMACGTPVVAARAGSVPEVLGDAGVLVETGDWPAVADALAVLLASEERRASLRDRGLARAAGFSWEQTARRTLEVYGECLAGIRNSALRYSPRPAPKRAVQSAPRVIQGERSGGSDVFRAQPVALDLARTRASAMRESKTERTERSSPERGARHAEGQAAGCIAPPADGCSEFPKDLAGRPDVSIVVLNYNGRRWLERCLSSLAGQQGVDAEIILVDNCSSDGSVAFVEQCFPSVRVLRLGRNCGFAAGNNAGAGRARGRFLAFLNNDTEADTLWAAMLKAALDANAAAGLAASRIVYLHDPELVDSAGDAYLRAGGAFKRGHGQMDMHFRAAAEVFGACGAAFMIRREVFDDLGGFDEDFFLVHEDVDLSYRAQLRDYRCIYVADALVHHAGSATMGTTSRVSVFHGQRNLEWVYLKNTPLPLLLRTLPAHAVYSLAGGAYLASTGHLGTYLSAKLAALAGLPAVLRKRRSVQHSRRTDVRRLWDLMDRGWLGIKLHEKRFDSRAVAAQRP